MALIAIRSARAEITNAPALEKSAYKVEIVARGLEHPWALQFLPDGRMLVTERPGRLRIAGKDGKISAPISGVPKVVARDQGGLLDLALSPDFATSSLIYMTFSEARDGWANGTSVLRARLVLEGGSGRLTDVEVIFRQQPAVASNHHFGSRIVVNVDGSLFVTLGERYSQRAQAQNPANHLGKIVRIQPDGTPYSGNPKLTGWAPEVWSIGHRNPQGAALDPVTGALWTTEHGAMGGDELNHPQAGKNYGWPVITYGRDYTGEKIGIGSHKEGMEQPVYYWDPSIATSGLAFYTGDYTPWKNNAFAGGLAGMQVARMKIVDGQVVGEEKLLADRGWRVRDVRMGADGAVWVLTDEPDGKLVRIVPGG
jgi:aldose sugar dehydrogenase